MRTAARCDLPQHINVAEDLKGEGDEATAEAGEATCDVALDNYEESWEKAVKSWCELE
jgi:hypothetical protein